MPILALCLRLGRISPIVGRVTRTTSPNYILTMAKRKRSSLTVTPANLEEPHIPQQSSSQQVSLNSQANSTIPPPSRRASRRGKPDTNPDHNADILDGKEALRASPDAQGQGEALDLNKIENAKPATVNVNGNIASKTDDSDSPLSDIQTPAATPKKAKKTPTKSSIAAKKGSDAIKAYRAEVEAKKAAEKKIKKEDHDDGMEREDPDCDAAVVEDADAEKLEAARPPPVNSSYLPLPWKGRIGYACLNTYLRFSNPPVFSSRTCRIASILDHRYPLRDPSQPEHSTKNRPDKNRDPDVARGQRYVEELGLANARDIPKMILWNDKYVIKFLRLSSEMFPFASHEVYGYKLAPFASEALGEAGMLAAKLGHRLTTHPGQFTQLGSPRPEVIKSAIRDLEYHDELLSLLKLPPQENRDAVMILHMGGTYGDKSASLDRFRKNYAGLSQSIKNRLVLENDDVSWSVHDLLPICEELNIPMVLDFHHHNIIFDSDQIREGTHDIIDLFPRIKATWDRKGIKQKMHYSEPTPQAITGRQRRKHNPRPASLPPCANDMDLMIEAKDKEQAVFELMRNFKLPGWDSFNNLIPYERADDNKPVPKKAKKKKTKKQIKDEIEEFGKELSEEEEPVKDLVKEEDVGMGGSENRVYWPPGMEEWLRPKKREIKKKTANGTPEEDEDENTTRTPATFKEKLASSLTRKTEINPDMKEKLAQTMTVGDLEAVLEEIRAAASAAVGVDIDIQFGKGNAKGSVTNEPAKKKAKTTNTPAKKKSSVAATKAGGGGKKGVKKEGSGSLSDEGDEGDDDVSMPDLSADDGEEVAGDVVGAVRGGRRSGRAGVGKRVSYKEVDKEDEDEENEE